MEITESTIYWITRLDGLRIAVGVFLAALFLFGAIWLIVSFADNELDTIKKHRWKLLVPIIFLTGLLVFIPTTKEMCAIKVIPLVVNDETVREIPKDIADLAHEWLDELRPKKESEQ